MKNNNLVKILLSTFGLFIFILIFTSSVKGNIIDTTQITRITPPPPPVAPRKPEPPAPPTVPGRTAKPTTNPTSTPTTNPTSTPIPTVTPTSSSGGETGGSSSSSSSSDSGSVLGATSMAGTGVVEDSILYSMFSLGSLLTSLGIMKNGKKKN